MQINFSINGIALVVYFFIICIYTYNDKYNNKKLIKELLYKLNNNAT